MAQEAQMNFQRVVFGFFIILALTLNFIFVMGDIDDITHHSVWVLTLAIIVNLIATGLKLGDRSQIGALLLAASLVADVLLISSRILWIVSPAEVVAIVSIAGGALVANIISAFILIGDTLMSRR
jgi:hypothetical protein